MQFKATQSRFAVYRHRPHAILKNPFIIHYLSLLCENTQNVKIFNTAMSKTFISPQYLTQQIETNLDLSRSRRSDRPYVTFDLRNVHATPTFEGRGSL